MLKQQSYKYKQKPKEYDNKKHRQAFYVLYTFEILDVYRSKKTDIWKKQTLSNPLSSVELLPNR